ncbi:stalk domain-containing protein [Paenibacillus riograndensis]|uniref:Copper amine oxidase domain-containing protein n=1 Tax=Paenibacillus riograndensis SBR5 TaxID=1073571 RepID=A0A0E4CW32_9BACL|nr:stalk domain-containing protein [Paenibacillus riograndensis]CQR54861.1 copper amine oxidase domain-containing protein [Paenibacillus riograndensis SBR5]
MKWLAKIVLCAAVTAAGFTSLPAEGVKAAAGGVSIVLDGYPLPFPVEPAVMSGTTMVPFRAISEALGVKVEWNQAAKQITATHKEASGTQKVILTLGSKSASVNGSAVKLAVAPQNIRGTTMIPLSFFGQQFGAGVAWNQATKTVSITSPKKDLYTLGFYAQGAYSEVSLIPDFDAVAFGWSRIDRSGQYTTSGTEFRWPQAAGDVTPESIVQNAAAGGTAPYLMVYSGDKELELTKNVENLQLQQQTIAGIVDTATQKGFRGIALDLEGLGMTGDKAVVQSQYNTFVKNLSAKAKAANLKLTVILHPLNSSYKGYDYKTLATIADDLVIMAYAYEGETGPEPMNKVDESIRLALQQVSKDKLILGISVYSENETSVNAKIGLAKRYGLKGIAIWRLGLIGQPVWSEMGKSVEW